MPDTVIAAQMYTLRKFTQTPRDVAAVLAEVRRIGYEAIQISAFGPIDPDELARILADTGLTVAATHTPWQRFVDDVERVVDEHRLWGCRHPAIGGMPREMRRADRIAEFARAAEDVGRTLAAAGMDFSYHNHNFELQQADGRTWLELLYAAADPQYLKAEIDTYWIQAGGGDPAEWIARYPGRQPLLHLKDMAMGPDGPRFAEIGEGNLNWRAILAAARRAGVQWYCVEQDQCYEREPLESLKISLENLHEMGVR